MLLRIVGQLGEEQQWWAARGRGGSHVSQISSACLRNGCFLEPLRDVRGVWECVCSWGLAQMHTFILSPFLCKYSAQTLARAAVCFFGIFGLDLLRFHLDSVSVRLWMWRSADDGTFSLGLFWFVKLMREAAQTPALKWC